MKRIVCISIILSLAIICAGCEVVESITGTGTSATKESSKAYVVLFDLSDVSKVESYFENYNKALLQKINGGDSIVVKVLTNDPISDTHSELRVDFPILDPNTGKRTVWNNEMRAAKDRASNDVHNLLTESVNNKLSSRRIIHSLYRIGQIFDKTASEDKTLIIFSSMVENSKIFDKTLKQNAYYDFCQDGWQLDRKKVTSNPECKNGCPWWDAIIKEEKSKERFAKLTGVHVFVVGGGSCNSDNPNEYRNIKNFWVKYFGSLDAELLPENYGPTLNI